jgi:hypothetical protein
MRRRPGRGSATVSAFSPSCPFPSPTRPEAAYALDVLRADGVVLLGGTDGIFLGDARFDEWMAELDRRKAIVFEHPNLHPTTSDIKTAMPGFMVEFLCDTTRAAGHLIFSGTLEKYRDIRFILSHAGGAGGGRNPGGEGARALKTEYRLAQDSII